MGDVWVTTVFASLVVVLVWLLRRISGFQSTETDLRRRLEAEARRADMNEQQLNELQQKHIEEEEKRLRITRADNGIGFSRSEMFTESLAGTVKPYDMHILLGYGPGSDKQWPHRVEDEGFAAAFHDAMACVPANERKRKALVTVTDDTCYSVTVLPDSVRYEFSSEPSREHLDAILATYIQNDEKSAAAAGDPVTSSQIFILVCAHEQRDKRCGYAGPILVDRFERELARRKQSHLFRVLKCSHVGGHKYAGNVIVFSTRAGDPKFGEPERVMGDWYGYVTPGHCPLLLDAVVRGQPIRSLLRGTMGVRPPQELRCGQDCGCSQPQVGTSIAA